MSCVENIIYEKSMNCEFATETSKFKSRDWIYCVDSNNSNYASGQLIFNCAPFATSNRYVAWSEGYFLIPITITTACPNAAANGMNRTLFLHGLKNGYWNIFNSFTITQNNTTIIQNVPFSNIYVSYKMLSELSEEEMKKYGRLIGFSKDNSQSTWIAGSNFSDGIGMVNNTNCFCTDGLQQANISLSNQGQGFNNGFKTRQQWNAKSSQMFGNQPYLTNAGINHTEVDDASHTVGTTILATIRLKDLHDYFRQVPLMKGANINFIINLNLGNITVDLQMREAASTNIVTRGFNLSLSSSNISMVGGATTFPMMISSLYSQDILTSATYVAGPPETVNTTSIVLSNGAGDITLTGAMASTQFKLSVNIGNVTTSSGYVFSHPITQCRLYVPVFEMIPEAEKAYLNSTTRNFCYDELFSFQYYGVQANQQFNVNITSGISNARQLLVCPLVNNQWQVNRRVNGADNNGAIGFNSLLSPFYTAPASLDYLPGGITDYQVIYGGGNIYMNPIKYSYQHYIMETKNIGLNGAYVEGLSSGLISQDDFETNLNYLITDLSNRSPDEQGMSRSITINGINNNFMPIDLFVFVVYQKKCVINVITGNIESLI